MSLKAEILAARPTHVDRLLDEIDQRLKTDNRLSLYDVQSVAQIAEIRQMLTRTVAHYDKTYNGAAEVGVGEVKLLGHECNVRLTITVDVESNSLSSLERLPVSIQAYFLK